MVYAGLKFEEERHDQRQDRDHAKRADEEILQPVLRRPAAILEVRGRLQALAK